MTKVSSKNIYVSLDSILDTRLGTLLKINQDFAFNVSSKEDYYNRVVDEFSDDKFGALDKDLYSKVYNMYSDEIIKMSMKTKMYVFLFELCNRLVMESIDGPSFFGSEIHINIHPFSLTDREISAIAKALHVCLSNQFTVKAINIPIEDFTCEVAVSNYCALFMYNYGDWLNKHDESLKKKLLKNLVLYVPKLNYIRPINSEERKQLDARDMDEYTLLSMVLCEFIKLQCLPISLYCADTPLNKA